MIDLVYLLRLVVAILELVIHAPFEPASSRPERGADRTFG
jgi:hypothetical protein